MWVRSWMEVRMLKGHLAGFTMLQAVGFAEHLLRYTTGWHGEFDSSRCWCLTETGTGLDAGLPIANKIGSLQDQLGGCGREAAPHLHGGRAHHLPAALGGCGHCCRRGVLHASRGDPVRVEHSGQAPQLHCLDGCRQPVLVVSMPEPAPPSLGGCHCW